MGSKDYLESIKKLSNTYNGVKTDKGTNVTNKKKDTPKTEDIPTKSMQFSPYGTKSKSIPTNFKTTKCSRISSKRSEGFKSVDDFFDKQTKLENMTQFGDDKKIKFKRLNDSTKTKQEKLTEEILIKKDS